MITKSAMLRIGLDKLISFLEVEDAYELQQLMVSVRCVTLEAFSAYLSGFACVCSYCNSGYIYIMNEDLICQDCLEYLMSKD